MDKPIEEHSRNVLGLLTVEAYGLKQQPGPPGEEYP